MPKLTKLKPPNPSQYAGEQSARMLWLDEIHFSAFVTPHSRHLGKLACNIPNLHTLWRHPDVVIDKQTQLVIIACGALNSG